MGKDSEKKVKDKKEKKEKKEKRAEVDGVKKSKKEKKEKKLKLNGNEDVADALESMLERDPDQSMVSVMDVDGEAAPAVLKGALVPFAEPLVDDAKEVKRVLRTVKKGEYIKSSLFPKRMYM